MATKLLSEPAVVSSVDGVLHTSLYLQVTTVRIEGRDFTTRTLNGTIPGPTLRLKPGDTLVIDFYNELPKNELEHIHNEFSGPNDSNLHFHGLHVSGELPSDDVTLVVSSGQSFRYNTTLPLDHMPGTHWIHPHRHGSTAIQVGGGAAGTIIVEDVPDEDDNSTFPNLPPQVVNAREVLLIAQEFDFEELTEVAEASHDSVVKLSGVVEQSPAGGSFVDISANKVYLVNGQVNPQIPMHPNEWIRLRMIHVGWLEGRLTFELPHCEMQLIAKDGVYLPEFPRKITEGNMVNAARADIMVRCPFSGSYTSHTMTCTSEICQGQSLVTLVKDEGITDVVVDDGDIEPIQTLYPGYLQDLRYTPPTPGCSCATDLDDLEMPEDMSDYYHQSFQGSVVERQLGGDDHPYHQHIHPFQIVDGLNNQEGPYYQVGDWHDTIEGNVLVRYSPTVFAGKMMIHCHRLDHEDEGMMRIEYIHPNATSKINPDTGNSCVCIPGFPAWGVALFVTGIVLVVLVLAILLIWFLRRRGMCLWFPWPCDRGNKQLQEPPASDEDLEKEVEGSKGDEEEAAVVIPQAHAEQAIPQPERMEDEISAPSPKAENKDQSV